MNQTTNQSRRQDVLRRFVDQAFLSEAQCQKFSAENVTTLRPVIDSGLVPQGVFADTVSAVYQCPTVSRDQMPSSAIADAQAMADFLVEHEVMPLSLEHGELRLAMADPSDELALQVIRAKLQCSVIVNVAIRTEILDALTQAYSAQLSVGALKPSVDLPEDLSSDSELVRDLHRLIQRAVSLDASDIHFEPVDSQLRVRFRVHGMLRNIYTFEAAQRDQVVARIKLMSKLDVTERRHAQNGRFKFPADGRVIDLRVSTLPLHDGESIVLRLLEFNRSQLSLQDLGFSESVAGSMQQAISTQQGLILITGPTGSGKSTTVYSLLNQLNKSEQKLISIEDPVELNIAGINQIQVDDEYGLSFSAALKTVLRQDPDVIMVGEIRDAETAQLAAQAALTGHLVLATLHTASASSAITRLQNLGLPSYLIASTVRAVLAQRLLRCKCKSCTQANDCNVCMGSGYSGRTTIAELLPTTAFNNALDSTETNLATKLLGGITLVDDSQRLVDGDITDQAEVFRVLGVSA